MTQQNTTSQQDGAQDDDGPFDFEVMVGGEYRSFSFDADETKFTGTEVMLVDQYAGDLTSWASRLETMTLRGSDLVLLAFLAARREQIAVNGTSELVWEDFAESVAPFTLRLPGETQQIPKPNRSQKRAAARSGSPARRAGTSS